MYFSKSFTRLLHFPIVFAPFPLVVIAFSCTFTVFFQHVCLLHRHSLFIAVTPVSSMFQQILHGLFLAFSSDRYHGFLKFHCIFQYILFVGFQYVCPAFFYYMLPIIFISFLHRFLHHFLWFPAFSYLFNINIHPRVLPVSFIFRSFLHHFPSLLSHFLRFHCIFPACLLHRHGLRLAFAPVSSIFQGIFHGLFLAFAPFSSVFQGILYDFL